MKKILKKPFYFLFGVAVIGLLAAVWGFVIEPNLLVVNDYNLKIKDWNPALNDFKIVVIGDIHGGSNFINEAKIRKIVEKANEQDADLIVLLGDYVSQISYSHGRLKMPMETVAENLKGLRARNGVIAVLGNHDGINDVKKIRSLLESNGYQVLENEVVTIKKNDQKLRIVGLPDYLSANTPQNNVANAHAALESMENKEGKIIVLAHNPDDIASVTGGSPLSDEFVLFLAAHTHGGQVKIPFVGALIVPTQMGRKYAAGNFRYQNVDCFVTSGIGTSLLPIRIGVPPEIAVLHISAE